MIGRVYVIGAGGIGCNLVPALSKLVPPEQVTVIDADRVEARNLDRQLFDVCHIGQPKAQVMAVQFRCNYIDDWFSFGRHEIRAADWIICCADNHPCRVAVLQTCDSVGCQAVIAGNEKHSAEAYFYKPAWQGAGLDPRVYYPEMLLAHDNDPTNVGGCAEMIAAGDTQLASANLMAAALALHLFTVWAKIAPTLQRETIPSLPYKLWSALSRLGFDKVASAP